MIALELDYSNFGSHDVLYRLDQSGIFFSPNSPYVLSSRLNMYADDGESAGFECSRAERSRFRLVLSSKAV